VYLNKTHLCIILMLFSTLNGRKVNVSLKQYLINWYPEQEVSGPQGRVKAFLKPYWERDMVLEEMRIPGSLFRIDLYNINKDIIVEIDGRQHDEFNSFMHGSLSGFRASIKRDLEKERWATLNGVKHYVVIKEKEIPLLSPEWLQTTFGVVL